MAEIDTSLTVNEIHDARMTVGDKVADSVASGMGSWRFIIIQTALVLMWVLTNVWLLSRPFDPFPFILLNLFFSTQASYAAPFIMMSQNRQAAKDRIAAEHDYAVNEAAKLEIENLINLVIQQNKHLDQQDKLILKIVRKAEAS